MGAYSPWRIRAFFFPSRTSIMEYTMEGNNILEVRDLGVSFGNENILHDISFTVRKGEALAIIGPNGAGKTVLFHALLGLLAYEGTIAWKEGVTIGYVPQKFAIEKDAPLSVKEFFLLQSGRFWFPKQLFLEHLEHELELVGLGRDILDRPIGGLSGGQLQRVLVSWAMLHHPDVILFDEPTAGIDVGFEETIYTLIHKMQKERGATVLLISHDLNIVYRYAHNVLCVNKTMICHGPPREVLKPEELAGLYGTGAFHAHKESCTHHIHQTE